jgi:hypothetical protein
MRVAATRFMVASLALMAVLVSRAGFACTPDNALATEEEIRARYRYRRISGDIKALAKGSAALGERLLRRFVYRRAHRAAGTAARRVLKVIGL